MDVVIAVAILGIMGGGIFGSFRYGFFTLQLVRENQRATQIILEKVETIRLYSWDQINTPGFVLDSFTEKYDPQDSTNDAQLTYTGTVTLANCPLISSYAVNLRQVTVTLQWMTRNIPHSRSLTTYIAKDGIQNYVY